MSIRSSDVNPKAAQSSGGRSPRRTSAHDTWMNETLGAALSVAPSQPVGDGPSGTQPSAKALQAIARYKAAVSSPKLDSSDFILNSLDLLKQALADAPPPGLARISQQYQTQDYAGAIRGLNEVASGAKGLLGAEVVSLIEKKGASLKDDPMANQSRRFYETRLAGHLDKEVKSSPTYAKSMDGLREILIARAKKEGKGNLNFPTDPDKLLLTIAGFNDNIEMGLKADSPKYQAKDREARPVDRKNLPQSRNQGVMKANQPNFGDLVADQNAENRVPERNTIDASVQGYSGSNKATPMVGSISGTTFTLVALLQDFMAANAKSPDLQKSVDDIVKAFVAQYVKQGFHSYGEMMDVLKEPSIQAVFAKAKVTVEMNIPDEVLEKANSEAQAYAKGVSLQGAMQDELKKKQREVQPTAEPNPSSARPGATPAPSLATWLRSKAALKTFPPRPGTYLEFGSDGDLQTALARITKELGPKAARVAGRPMTIEIYDGLKGLLNVAGWKPEAIAEPTTPSALELLAKGTLKEFGDRPGDTYWEFGSAEDQSAAVAQILKEFGQKAFRVTRVKNTLQLFEPLVKIVRE